MGTAGWPAGTDPKLAFLGAPFLSQVYLVVDYETGVFSLAPINRSSPAQNLVTLGCDQKQVGNSNSTTPASSGQSKKSNTGAIAGGVVGGIAGLALIAGLLFWRRRRNNQQVPVETVNEPGLTKEQSELQQMGFHQNPYDAPPAFSPSASPGPYSPSTSPGPYGSMNMAAVPLRRPLPGHDQYPQSNSPPPMQHGYYDNQQPYHVPTMASGPAELGTTEVSELSGQPMTYPASAFDDNSVVSGQTGKQT